MKLDFEKMTVEELSAEELSVVLDIHEETVKKLAKTQQFPSIQQKTGYIFSISELLRLLGALEESAV